MQNLAQSSRSVYTVGRILRGYSLLWVQTRKHIKLYCTVYQMHLFNLFLHPVRSALSAQKRVRSWITAQTLSIY